LQTARFDPWAWICRTRTLESTILGLLPTFDVRSAALGWYDGKTEGWRLGVISPTQNPAQYWCTHRSRKTLGPLSVSPIPQIAKLVLIQQCLSRITGWTLARRLSQNPGMRRSFRIDKLSDEFGQYHLILRCEACGHERRTLPQALANLCGWDARLENVTARLRCSKCGERKCAARALPQIPPRRYKSH
jgi:hypothetical protein